MHLLNPLTPTNVIRVQL